MRSINWQAMAKVKKKNDKQRQRLDKVRKRDDRATNEKAVSKTCVEKSSIPSADVHVANNQIILMGHRTCRIGVNYRVEILQPLILRTCLQRHKQLLINIYSPAQKDLADRRKKKYTDCQSARKWGNNTMQNGKGAPDHFQNSENMNNNATEWKCRWLGKIQCTGILNENVTKKEWKWPGKMQRTGILRKKRKRKWLGKMQRTGILLKFSKVGRSVIGLRSG